MNDCVNKQSCNTSVLLLRDLALATKRVVALVSGEGSSYAAREHQSVPLLLLPLSLVPLLPTVLYDYLQSAWCSGYLCYDLLCLYVLQS